MPFDFSRLRTVVLQVPQHGKLAYCLLRDPRVPLAPKLALVGALGLVLSPIDIPGWIPVLGDFDVLALGILAVKVFVDACPSKIVAEHEAALKSRESRFDQDIREVIGAARSGAERVYSWISELAGGRAARPARRLSA